MGLWASFQAIRHPEAFSGRKNYVTDSGKHTSAVHTYVPELVSGQVEVLQRVLEPPEGVGRDIEEAGVGDLEVDDLEVLEDEVGEALHGRVVYVQQLDDDALRVRLHRRHQQRELSKELMLKA